MPDDNQTGGRRRAVEPEDAREVLENADEPVLSTSEVSDRLGVSRPTAGKRLNTLQERGEVDYADVGGSKAWYLTEVTEHRLSEYTDGEPPNSEGDTYESRDEPDKISSDTGKTSLEGVVDGGFLGGFVVGIVAVLALLFSPSSELLVSVARGGWATVAIMIPLRGLRIDRRFGRWFDGVRDTVDDEGGPVAFIKRRASEESLGPENPRTPIERVARYDLRAFVLFIIASTLASLISGIYYTVGFEPFVGTPVVELLVLLSAAVVLLFTLGTILLWGAIFASVLVERARMQAGTEQPVGGSNG